jgi:hypothetical protein
MGPRMRGAEGGKINHQAPSYGGNVTTCEFQHI